MEHIGDKRASPHSTDLTIAFIEQLGMEKLLGIT